MHQALYQAATTGNVALFNQSVAIHCAASAELEQYLLSQTTDTKENVIHVAVDNDHEAFINELEIQLPSSVIVALICQQNKYGRNPLHNAAISGHLEIVKILIQSYHKFLEISTDEANTCFETRVVVGDNKRPPWAATGKFGETPLTMAILKGDEEVAAYILSQDMEILCNKVDIHGKSPLYLAVEKGVERIALQILTSGCSYNLGRILTNNQMLLHNASGITEQVAILLLEKHPKLLRARDSRGESFLHEWAFRGELESLQCLLKGKVFWSWNTNYRNLLRERNNFGCNPIHRAVLSGKVEVIKFLIGAYFQSEPSNGREFDELPWLHMDRRGETPLDVAIKRHLEDIALYLLTLDSVKASLSDNHGTNPLFLAVESGCADVAEEIMLIGSRTLPTLLRSGPRGQNPFHVASKCPGIAGHLIEFLGSDIMYMKDADGKAPLDYAAQVGDIDIMELVFDFVFEHANGGTPRISSAPYAWVGACKGGHMDALRMFMNNCDFKQLCLEQRDTPLHHIELKSQEEYQEFLAVPLIWQLKNVTDSDGATPLHRVIERKDIVFVELLLGTHGIDWNIKDRNGQTALNLLAKLCDEFPDWDAMCNRIHMNPRIKKSYIPLKANLAEIRTTLSVVAALLATIIF